MKLCSGLLQYLLQDGADRTQTDEGDATMDESSMEPEYTDQQEGKRNSKAKQGIKKETTAYLNEGNVSCNFTVIDSISSKTYFPKY